MSQHRNEVGPCGNYCSGCRDYQAQQTNDEDLRRALADDLSKELGRPISPENVGCEGCWGTIHNDVAASLMCPVRQCAEKQSYATCAECSDFPCATYLEQFDEESEYATNIKSIRRDGLDTWIAERILTEGSSR